MTSLRSTTLPRRLVALVAAIVAAVAFAAAAPAKAGTIVADSGFRPNPDGFSFENYGDEKPYVNLNAAEMQKMFGDAVCQTFKNGRCVLSSAARTVMDLLNESMGGGHCYGFAVLSETIHRGWLPRFGYQSIFDLGGGPTTFDLEIEDNVRLQRSIARAFSFQGYPSVDRKTIASAPSKVLEALIDQLKPNASEVWTFAIFKPDMSGGHAITPYAVEDMGGGIYEVHVYDNNWPDDANRRLRINTNNDTWSYFAAINPNEKEWLYEGDAKTKTLRLMPTTPAYGIQPCYFCAGRRGWKAKSTQITLDSGGEEHAHLLLTDHKGRKTGYLPNGKFVNEIPGVKVTPRSSGGVHTGADGQLAVDSLEPIYRVPNKLRVGILVDGRHLTANELQSLTVIGPSFDATVQPIRLRPGQVAKLRLNPGAERLVYRPSPNTRRPELAFGGQAKKIGLRLSIASLRPMTGKAIKIRKDSRRGRIWIADTVAKRHRYQVKLTAIVGVNDETAKRGFALRGRQRAYVDYSRLLKKDQVWVVITNRKGKPVKRLKLS